MDKKTVRIICDIIMMLWSVCMIFCLLMFKKAENTSGIVYTIGLMVWLDVTTRQLDRLGRK